MDLKITAGPAIIGHLCTLAELSEISGRARTVLTHHYAAATGMDVHPAETHVVEVRPLGSARAHYELRLGTTIIATAHVVIHADEVV